jgi:hypothetical protein
MGGKDYASCGLRYHYTLWTAISLHLVAAISLHLVAAISLHLVDCDIITPCGCDIITPCGCDIITPCGCVGMAGCHTLLHKCHHINISTPHHLNTSTSQFTVMWKQPCLTSYLTRQRFCSRISRSTSESTHFSESLRTCRRRGPSGSSTV